MTFQIDDLKSLLSDLFSRPAMFIPFYYPTLDEYGSVVAYLRGLDAGGVGLDLDGGFAGWLPGRVLRSQAAGEIWERRIVRGGRRTAAFDPADDRGWAQRGAVAVLGGLLVEYVGSRSPVEPRPPSDVELVGSVMGLFGCLEGSSGVAGGGSRWSYGLMAAYLEGLEMACGRIDLRGFQKWLVGRFGMTTSPLGWDCHVLFLLEGREGWSGSYPPAEREAEAVALARVLLMEYLRQEAPALGEFVPEGSGMLGLCRARGSSGLGRIQVA